MTQNGALLDARAVVPAIRSALPSLTALEVTIVERMLATTEFPAGTALREIAGHVGVG